MNIQDSEINTLYFIKTAKINTTSAGAIKKSAANLTTIIQLYPGIGEGIGFDTFLQKIMKSDKCMFGKGPWSSNDTTALEIFLSENFDVEFPDTQIDRVVSYVANKNKFHSGQEYLNSLIWDGKKRVESWLENYYGADGFSPGIKTFQKVFLIGAVARIMQPGCKNDTALMIKGKQGIRKSTGLRALFGAEWFSDAPLDLGSKDCYLGMKGKWCIEMAELGKFKGVDPARLKAFFSQTTDDYRPPYQRHVINVPRQCVFVGTANSGNFLKDPTGNRRFMPITATRVDVEGLIRDRDMIWAEAKMMYEKGEEWWFDADDAGIKEAQEDQFEIDPWEDPIKEYVDELIDDKIHIDTIYSILNLEINRVKRFDNQRIRDIMHRLGWKSGRPYVIGKQKRGFIKDS
jgi:putative DNA primase/helicase